MNRQEKVEFVGQMLLVGESLLDALRMAGVAFNEKPSEFPCVGRQCSKGVVRTPLSPDQVSLLVWEAENLAVGGMPEAKKFVYEVYSGKNDIGFLTRELHEAHSLYDLRCYFLMLHRKDGLLPSQLAIILRSAGFNSSQVWQSLDRAGYFEE